MNLRDRLETVTKVDKKQLIKSIYETLYKIYLDKNSDYGNSFQKLRDKYNDKFPVILIRLYDKIFRIEQLLLYGNQKVKDESVRSALGDLANYCIMEMAEMDLDK